MEAIDWVSGMIAAVGLGPFSVGGMMLLSFGEPLTPEERRLGHRLFRTGAFLASTSVIVSVMWR